MTLRVRNLGKRPIYVFADSEFATVRRNGNTLVVDLGAPDVNYGIELPVLRRVGPDNDLESEVVLVVPPGPTRIKYLSVQLSLVLEGAGSIDRQLQALEGRPGWWTTHDLGLTDRFRSLLLDDEVSFGIPDLTGIDSTAAPH